MVAFLGLFGCGLILMLVLVLVLVMLLVVPFRL